jgi:hypothetical protein
VKTINSRTNLALGAMLAATVITGFGSVSGYSNHPDGYDVNRSYSQRYENSHSYDAAYRDGV